MKKILTLFAMLLVASSMAVVQAATSTTVYYAVPSATVGTYTVKLNVNRKGDGNDWQQYTMTLSDKTYNSNPIYTYTFTDLYDGLGALQFQLYDGNTWKSQVQPINSWTGVATYNGKMWVHGGDSWREYAYDGAEPIPSYTFTAGTVIYYDLTAYSGGINVLAPIDGDNWRQSTSVIIDVTLSTDWEVTANTALFRSGANNDWGDRKCETLPTEGQNMIVSTNGINCHWDTYVPAPATPDVYTVVGTFTGLDWDQTSSTNDMTESEGIYTLTLTGVELAAMKYEYKMVKNHSWDVSYPAGSDNAEYVIGTAGIYDLTFTLNLSATPAYSVTPTLIQETVVTPAVKLNGTFSDGSTWGYTDEFEIASNKESASLTVNIPQAGNYEFKVVVGGSQLGNGYTFHRDFVAASGISTGANMVLEAEVAGNYTFKWIYANDSLHIDFPECDYYIKNNWYGCGAWKWKGMTKDNENDTYRIENVVYGGNGVNYNTVNSDEGATWKKDSVLFYMDGNKQKKLMAYDTVNFVLDPANDTIWAEMVKKDVTVYTVAGSELALFSQGWAPSHPHKYTEMKKQTDGTYKWTNNGEEASLCAGPIAFKVIKNGSYDNGSWPDGKNDTIHVLRSGEYMIEINFNPCTESIWVDTTFVKELNIQALSIKGFGDWETGHALARNDGNNKALVTLSLTKGTHEFKLVDGNNRWYGDGQAFTRETPSIRGIVVPEGNRPNMTINVDTAGEYIFTYIFETEQLVVSYPVIVPEEKIAPLSGEFSIGAPVTSGLMSNKVRFARGNLQYNYGYNGGEGAWYTAEKQYEVLSDMNLRLGDEDYSGSVDLFDWSCESSLFGLLPSNVNADYTGNFEDWGQKFEADENEWFTLSETEWWYLLGRTKDNHKLWTVMGIAVDPDTIIGLALFPDNWETPDGLPAITYSFYNLDDEAGFIANSFSQAQWESMEEAGAVFLPLGGARAGHWGNMHGIDGATLVDAPLNPLANYKYCWVDNVNEMAYYWLRTVANATDVKTAVFPGISGENWASPQVWGRARRYGQSVRLVTRVPRVDYIREDLTEGRYGTICLPSAGTISNAKLYDLEYYDGANTLYLLEVNGNSMEAGRPYIFLPSATLIEVIYTDKTKVDAGSFNGLIGSLAAENVLITPNAGNYILYNNQYYFVDDEAYVAPNRAYIHMDDVPTEPSQTSQGNAPRRRIAMTVHGEQNATGFDELNASEAPAKMFRDGQLFILRGEKIYDATGRLVK